MRPIKRGLVSDIIIVALIGAIPATIGAFLSHRNGKNTKDIKIIVNGEKARLVAELKAAQIENQGLQRALLIKRIGEAYENPSSAGSAAAIRSTDSPG